MRKLRWPAVLYSDAYLRPAARHSAAVNTMSLISIASDVMRRPIAAAGERGEKLIPGDKPAHGSNYRQPGGILEGTGYL